MFFNKKIFSNLPHSYRLLLPLFFFLLTLIAFGNNAFQNKFKISKQNTASQKFNVKSTTVSKFFVDVNENTSNTVDEFICEEECDDETKEIHVNFPSDLLITLVKPTTNLSSKEFVYYNSNYNIPVSLYTLFCSWKFYLV
jgi:hypothetical protein